MNRLFRLSVLQLNRFDELGVSSRAVLRAAGVPAPGPDADRVLLTTEQLFALWHAVRQSSSNPAIGLEVGTEPRIERYDPVAMAGLYARSLGDALERIARYKRLTCPEEVTVTRETEREMGRDTEGDGPRRIACVTFGFPLAVDTEPPAFVDTAFAWIMTIARRGIGAPFSPRRVELMQQPHPADPTVHERYFGCPVRYGSARNTLIFDAADLDRPFVTHNPELLRLLTPHLDAELTHYVDARTTGDQVKGALKRVLAGGRPAMTDVAKELGLSPRTLQRRLTDEGVSFQQVLLDARRELARHYLKQPSLELNEAAYLLGYNDPNSFFRAFHEWEGTSPGAWRAQNLQPELERAG
jgi:AraC-like DNA-binding protein